jgi:DNA-binding XRE family transcriptional regulator
MVICDDPSRPLCHRNDMTRRYRANPTPLAAELRDLRLAASLTQEQAAVLISVSQEYMSNIERGVRIPRPERLARIRAVYATRAGLAEVD